MSETNADDFIHELHKIESVLASLTEKQISRLAEHTLYIGTKNGRIDGHSPAAILEKATAVLDPDEGYYLHLNDRLEVSVTVCPKSNYSWKNGPEGNFVMADWKVDLFCPPGIRVTRFDLEKAQPVNVGTRNFITASFEAIEKKFKNLTLTLPMEKQFKANKFPPGNKMFLFAKRPVVIHNNVPLDEGRASEYFDISSASQHISNLDFRFNRVPEVLAVDQKNKVEQPMSYHDVHLLGSQAVFQVIITPRAYVHSNQLSWEFRIISVKVLGKKELEIAQSPSKQVQKQKAVFIDLDDDDEDRIQVTPTKKAKKASGSSAPQDGPSEMPPNHHTHSSGYSGTATAGTTDPTEQAWQNEGVEKALNVPR
ncbi:hypothetical protein F5050DRAFT_1715483 [Lentinula boryana]|uniref:Uncharacterized protein n=1 Tax=Lentinula boryana TaxID=40481 RepID=A0ABQ8Q0F7_9AGAR|nr:hypothetical protein F5050DRAFT_1715483 [Lentinula boryana]